MPLTSDEIDKKLREERNIWLTSVRPGGAPHLVPIWFIAHDGRIYLCTAPDSVKVRNIRKNSRVSLALEDGSAPVILEGTAQVLELDATPAMVIDQFKTKYDWDVRTDKTYTVVVEVTPVRRLNW
ncbi:MAG: pyridoxamine 5'-phosphate oxidase family protein [Chloroflexi bacterium]|nr:pyridoxamine 5'-phosphate oxidase family protein [Chloroflexota bacterium]